MAVERLDLVIFGATGFTGKYTLRTAQKLRETKGFSLGVAGRSKEKLEAVIKEFAPNSEGIEIIIADVKDEESLKKMAERAKVVVNTCGPYRFYGEPVVKACIAAKTHHVDVSGEPQYMEKMQLDYDEAARKAGVYVISACGFDSIPCDLGIIFTQQKFDGEVNSVETYFNTWAEHNLPGPRLNYGTWESAIYGFAHAEELRELRAKLYPKRLPKFEPRLLPRGSVHKNEISPGFSVPFPGSDRAVANRSQRYLFEHDKQRPAQIQCYVTLRTVMAFLTLVCVGAVFTLLAKFKCGRSLLLKYPGFFSRGFITLEGPSPEIMEKTLFSITVRALGWKDKVAEPTDKHTEAPNREIITKVSGINPGYGATCVMLLLSALTILKDNDKMPDNGGVFPPGAAFSKTSLIEELNKNGVKFEVLSTKDL